MKYLILTAMLISANLMACVKVNSDGTYTVDRYGSSQLNKKNARSIQTPKITFLK